MHHTNAHISRVFVLALSIPLIVGARSVAQPYEFDWVTVGDPGNRDTLPHEVPLNETLEIGGVDYIFRIARNKIRTTDYLEFVRAYSPFYGGDGDDDELTGWWIGAEWDGFGWQYEPYEGTENYGASLSWEMAARYCNWLHNDRVGEQWAFEDGAYDTSSFYRDDDGFYQHQQARHSDARFWIPSQDEYAKAAYWDPEKDGTGGYWLNPDGGMEALFEALPEHGGETIGDLLGQHRLEGAWDLEQYAHVETPWGLIDVSATLGDWTETAKGTTSRARWIGGSRAQSEFYDRHDRVDFWDADRYTSVLTSLRLATVVPAPGGPLLPVVSMLVLVRPRRLPCSGIR